MGTSNLLITLGTFAVASKSIMTIVAGEPVTDGLYVLGYGFITLGLFARALKWAQEEAYKRASVSEKENVSAGFYN